MEERLVHGGGHGVGENLGVARLPSEAGHADLERVNCDYQEQHG